MKFIRVGRGVFHTGSYLSKEQLVRVRNEFRLMLQVFFAGGKRAEGHCFRLRQFVCHGRVTAEASSDKRDARKQSSARRRTEPEGR